MFLSCRVRCLQERKSRAKAILELEKELSKATKNDEYYERFRSSGIDAKASMELVETYKLFEVQQLLLSFHYCFHFIFLAKGDSRDLPFVSKCMTSESGDRVKAQLILSDPPGEVFENGCVVGNEILSFRKHCFESGKQQQNSG